VFQSGGPHRGLGGGEHLLDPATTSGWVDQQQVPALVLRGHERPRVADLCAERDPELDALDVEGIVELVVGREPHIDLLREVVDARKPQIQFPSEVVDIQRLVRSAQQVTAKLTLALRRDLADMLE